MASSRMGTRGEKTLVLFLLLFLFLLLLLKGMLSGGAVLAKEVCSVQIVELSYWWCWGQIGRWSSAISRSSTEIGVATVVGPLCAASAAWC